MWVMSTNRQVLKARSNSRIIENNDFILTPLITDNVHKKSTVNQICPKNDFKGYMSTGN